LKGLNNWLENRVKTLEEELKNSKNDFENLELIYKNSSCKCNPSVYENCESIKKKVHYLETVLASQIMFLENLVWVSLHRVRKMEFQSLTPL